MKKITTIGLVLAVLIVLDGIMLVKENNTLAIAAVSAACGFLFAFLLGNIFGRKIINKHLEVLEKVEKDNEQLAMNN